MFGWNRVRDSSCCCEEALGGALSEAPAKMHFAGPTKCIFLFPEGRELCLAGMDIAMVPTALRKLWAVRCPRRQPMHFAGSQKCILPLAFRQLDLCNFRTCDLKTQVFRTRVQDVETRVPRTLSLLLLLLFLLLLLLFLLLFFSSSGFCF